MRWMNLPLTLALIFWWRERAIKNALNSSKKSFLNEPPSSDICVERDEEDVVIGILLDRREATLSAPVMWANWETIVESLALYIDTWLLQAIWTRLPIFHRGRNDLQSPERQGLKPFLRPIYAERTQPPVSSRRYQSILSRNWVATR